MKCFTHPQADAVAQCSQCHKGICTFCAHDVEEATLCMSCLQSGLSQEIARSRRSVVGVWVFTGIVTAIAAIAAFGSIGTAGAGAIFSILLAFALSWCLFWGWSPVWNWFRRQGFWIAGSWFVVLIVICLTFEILIMVAIGIGAFTGIKKYNEARRIVANGSQMIAELSGVPGVQGGGAI
jgi:hypothetical protein